MSEWNIIEDTFETFDGTKLFYRSWHPGSPREKALILLHRGHEHSGRITRIVEALNLTGFSAFAFDLRGHGQSPGDRGYAESYDMWVQDLNAFAIFLSSKYGFSYPDMAIVANSVGAVTASTWVHDYAPPVRCMVLAAPAFRIKLYVPLAIPMLRLLQKVKGKAFVTSYVKSRMLTHDPAEARRYDEDELITRRIAVNLLLDLHDTSTRILADAGAITTPTLIFSAGSDCVVKASAQQEFFDRLSSPVKKFRHLEDFYHAVFYEKDSDKVIAEAREFILKSFETENDTADLLSADQAGYTKDEYDELTGRASPLKAIAFGVQKLAMRTLGKLSKGVRIGLESGFDSGKSLDHVYQNKAQGVTPLGRFIDRCYLDAVGWKGIRQRKVHLMDRLRYAIGKSDGSGEEVRIMDIASGPGRYLLETVKALPEEKISLLLRDNDETNLTEARRLADASGIKNVAFARADAFDRGSVASVRPKPHVVVVSGLYELFPGNAQVLESLRGIVDVLEDDGFLLYTCQPWHPQVEMIARTLNNREGQPWIMRRRTQAEMDELVRSVGLKKLDTLIDKFGIFTVSIAQKRS